MRQLEAGKPQTSPHALNSIIEAARACDAGRAFAVAAAEVKKLSANSKNASMSAAALPESTL